MFSGRSSCMVLEYGCFLSWLSDIFVNYALYHKGMSYWFSLNLLVHGASLESLNIFGTPFCLFSITLSHHPCHFSWHLLAAFAGCPSVSLIHLLSKALFLGEVFKRQQAKQTFLFWHILGRCCRDHKGAKPFAEILFSWSTRENRLPQLRYSQQRISSGKNFLNLYFRGLGNAQRDHCPTYNPLDILWLRDKI